MNVDSTGYSKTYVIFYNNSKSGFKTQAINSPYYKNNKVTMVGVGSSNDFINAWNKMSGSIDYVYLYLHGGTGVLYFRGETLGFSGSKNFKKLKSKQVKKLYICLVATAVVVRREIMWHGCLQN